MKVTALKENLNKDIAPVYIVKGGDSYLREKAAKIFQGLVAREYSDFNFSVMSLSDGANSVVDALQTMPVFDEKRIVLVKETAEKQLEANLKILDKYIEDPNPTSVLVLFAEGDNLKPLEKKTEIVDCGRLEDAELIYEIEKILEVEPVRTMDDGAKRMLISFTQGNLSRIANELLKLKSYVEEKITSDDVRELVFPDIETRIYELSSAMSERNNAQALKVLDAFIKDAVSPNAVFGLLINQYRRMLHINLSKEESVEELAKILGVQTGAVFRLKRVAKNYTQIKLKKIVEMLAEMQYKIVSESVDGNFALQNAVATLMVI
ncbi:MAG: DNA polymerase III subunit delta [Clostridia bacterium]|nr:DNA polymerase III subunit delta [Clostridia bacterium]